MYSKNSLEGSLHKNTKAKDCYKCQNLESTGGDKQLISICTYQLNFSQPIFFQGRGGISTHHSLSMQKQKLTKHYRYEEISIHLTTSTSHIINNGRLSQWTIRKPHKNHKTFITIHKHSQPFINIHVNQSPYFCQGKIKPLPKHWKEKWSAYQGMHEKVYAIQEANQ